MSALVAHAHPSWCSRNRCDLTDRTLPVHSGAHRSEPLELDLAPLVVGSDRLQVASAYLYRSDDLLEPATFLVLESTQGRLVLPVLKAAGVLAQLSQLLATAELS